MLTPDKIWLLCLSCKFGKVNESKKETSNYIHCMFPRIHPQFGVSYFLYFKEPLISCKYYKTDKNKIK